MAAVFLNHGGGPLPLLGDSAQARLTKYLSTAGSVYGKPKAILIASAHWEEVETTFLAKPNPGLLYDYYGFPPESYNIEYPAKNSLSVLESARALLAKAGIPSHLDKKRDYDHGVFVPLKLMYPDHEIPVVQVSLPRSRDPGAAYRLGRALAPLRKEGVLIVGSGLSFHNLPAFFSSDNSKTTKSAAFDKDLQEAMLSTSDREARLKDWGKMSFARYCHPAEDHLIPLMFIAGAGHGEDCRVVFEDTLMGTKISGFDFPAHTVVGEKSDL